MGKRNVIKKAVRERTRAASEPAVIRTAELRDSRPRVHVVGLHHTVPDETFSHCAFTGKVLRSPDVLRKAGYRVTEYSNGVSHSTADEHVQIFTRPQLQDFFGDEAGLLDGCTSKNHSDPDVRQAFLALVKRELIKRSAPGDIVAHTFGPIPELVQALPDCVHVETGIGYAQGPGGCYRIFESETWRSWHFGKYALPDNGGGGTWPHYPEIVTTAVVPNYYNAEQWALGEGLGLHALGSKELAPVDAGAPGEKPYLLFVGRMGSIKGIEIVNAIASALPDITVAVITGDHWEDFKIRMPSPNLLWVGRVSARAALARWYGGALATLTPSRFHEPFGGTAVESLLCGTPVLASDFAAFVETVQDGDGLRCMTTDDFVQAAHMIVAEQTNPDEWSTPSARAARQARAQARFGLDAVALRYRGAFEAFARMRANGIKPVK